MTSKQPSWYGQMPGAYPAEEDDEGEIYLQMMNDLAEEECNVGPSQSQLSHTASSQVSDNRQEHYTISIPAGQSSHKKSAHRQHPYARPSVRAPGDGYQTAPHGNNRVRHVGPIRHGGDISSNHGSSTRQMGFNNHHRSTQQRVSKDYEGYAESYPPSYDAQTLDFSRQGPPQNTFGDQRDYLHQEYTNFSHSSVPDRHTFYQGQQNSASQWTQYPQSTAYEQTAATMHDPSPYLAAPSNAYATSRATIGVAASKHGSHPTAKPIDLQKTSQSQPAKTEAEKSKKGEKKRVVKGKGSDEEKEPPKRKAKGQSRISNGRLECISDANAESEQWEPAIRMDDCRRELIDQQDRLAAQLGMSYRDPDPVGTGLNDETAFKIEHADWGSDRAHLPEICWRYNEDEENNPRPSNNPGYMRFKGMIVLDPNDDPVKDWPQLPLTLSSKTRGYRLEIMSRENPHLEYRDFIARMPSLIEKPKKNRTTGETEVIVEAPDPNVVCNMRMFRFRKEKGMLSWTEKGKTKVIGQGLEKLFGISLINNSMKSFGRDLTPMEQVEIRKGRDAHFPESNPAGSNKKRSRDVRRGSKTQSNTKAPKASQQKRVRDDSEDSDSAEVQGLGQLTAASYRKRRRNARGEASRPTIDLDHDQDPSATGTPRQIVEVGSSLTRHVLEHPSHRHSDANSDNSEDEDWNDGEYENMTSHRPIRPLPARRAHGEAKRVPPLDLAQTQEHEQDYIIDGDSGSDSNAAHEYGDTDGEMTDVDDLADVLSSASHDVPAEDAAEEVIEADKAEYRTPWVRQETDLERHRRKTREFLGEKDDFFFRPEPTPPWITMTLFPPQPKE